MTKIDDEEKKEFIEIRSDEENDVIKDNGRSNAGIFSKKLYCYLNSFFATGWDRDLIESDITAPQDKVRSKLLCERLEKEWEKQLKSEKPSLAWAITKAFLPELLVQHSLGIWFSEFLRVFQCFILSWLIASFALGDYNMSYVWSLLFGLCSIVWTISYHPCFIYYQRTGAYVRIAVCSLMFKKLLKLSQSSLLKTSRGQIINLMSNDVMRYDVAFIFVNHLFIGPVQCMATVYFLWEDYGYSSLGGIGVVVLLAVLQSFQSRIFYMLRMMTAKRSDSRIRVIDEMINSMKAIKIYCWENYFAKIIQDYRTKEVKAIWFAQMMRGIFFSFFVSGPKLVTFASFIIFVSTSTISSFSPEKVFFMIAILNVTRLSCSIFFPLEMMFLSEAYGATKRIETYLLLPERKNIIKSGSAENSKTNSKVDTLLKPVGSLEISDMSFSWNDSDYILKNLTIDLDQGSLLVITGSVGSGKSSFLVGLLDELSIHGGSCYIPGKISYCPQSAWIFIGTVQANILFGSPYDPERYKEVIEAAALKRDFELFPHGDKTLIGDQGVTLSGGQRARVNFARAIYKHADIYILDDPFSAVDPRVGKKLAKSVQTFLQNKTRIVVTHQEHYLPLYNKLIHITDGKITNTKTQVIEKEVSLEDVVVDEIIDTEYKPKSTNEKFKEKNKIGSIGFGLIKRYMSLKYPFYVFCGYLFFELTSLLIIFFSDIWLKLWLDDVSAFTKECSSQLEIDNTTNCNPKLMDLPNASYYHYVYIGK